MAPIIHMLQDGGTLCGQAHDRGVVVSMYFRVVTCDACIMLYRERGED